MDLLDSGKARARFPAARRLHNFMPPGIAFHASLRKVDPDDLTSGAPACQQVDERLGQEIEAVPVLLDHTKSTLPYPSGSSLLPRYLQTKFAASSMLPLPV
ncbi:MAG: hypothetical protein P4M07_21750 [Xanthobacteraceae bacterium]|nr:hypothetical protein [Xanthobacteraceae bacterium]